LHSPFLLILTIIVEAEAMLHQIGWHNYAAPEVIPHIHREVSAPKVAELEDVALREPTVVDESVLAGGKGHPSERRNLKAHVPMASPLA
jgi:hypothetical protein